MSDDKEKKLKRRERALDAMYMMVGFLVVIVVAVYAINFGGSNLSKDPAEWGVFGDFFGGVLNPIFAFFSFALLLINLHLQRKQLDKTEEQLELNREELKLTREELKKAADAQVDSAKVMNEQLKTQTLQQFENNFYQLFSQLNVLQDDLLAKWRNDIERMLNAKNISIFQARDRLIKDRRLSRYFILLYQIMKLISIEVPKFPSAYLINSDDWGNEKREQKKFYTNLIRSQQDNIILQILFINCFDDGFPEFREYLEEASFFKHMRLVDINSGDYNYLLLSALPCYILDEGNLKKSKGIPFFDKGVGLSGLIKPKMSFLLRHIYRVKNKKLLDFEFVEYLYKDFLSSRAETSLLMFNEKNTIEKIYFSTLYFIELRLANDQSKKININLKVKRIYIYEREVEIIGINDEKMILDLDYEQIRLENIDGGSKSEFDGWYIFE